MNQSIQRKYFDSENEPSYDETSNSFIHYWNRFEFPKLSNNDFDIEKNISKEEEIINQVNNTQENNSENNEKESNIKSLLKEENNFSQDDSTELIKKKRHRGKQNSKGTNNGKVHSVFSADNLLRKIQVHYLNFLVEFINEILKYLGFNQRLFSLDYNFKKNVNKKHMEYLQKTQLREILSNNISYKFSLKKRDINRKIIEQITEYPIINSILSLNYIILFKEIYYKNIRIINLKEYGMNATIYLSKNIQMYEDLLLKNKERINYDNYLRRIEQCVHKKFLLE